MMENVGGVIFLTEGTSKIKANVRYLNTVSIYLAFRIAENDLVYSIA